MKLKVVVCVLVALFAISFAEVEEEDGVLVLDSSNFQETVAKHPLMLIEFYAPWCGHCKKLAPEYAQAAQQLKGEIALAKVDCTDEQELCSQYGVRGFPTLKVFRNDGAEPAEYDQGRTADAIVKFMKKQNAPAFVVVRTAEELKSAQSDDVTVVAFVASEDAAPTFIQLAKELRNKYGFALVVDSGVTSAEGAANGEVYLYKKFEDGAKVKFEGDISDKAALSSFIIAESFPLVGEIGPENFRQYVERGLPLMWTFLDYAHEKTSSILGAVTEAAKVLKGKVSVVKLDGIRWADHAKNFGLSGENPGVVIEDREKNKKYIFPQSEDHSKIESLTAFARDFLSNKLTAHVKSEPEPTSQDGPVTVLVGTNFESIVFDASKHVFVELYAPWCGHCKSLQPKYDELGALYKGTDVVIAKVDATANDVPVEIQGFPTLLLYRTTDKSNPVSYEGERTVEAMASWLQEQTGVKASAAPKSHSHDHDHDHHDHHHGHEHGHEEL